MENIHDDGPVKMRLFLYPHLETPTTIRILIIHPGDSSLPIACSLNHADLSSAPIYEAISYTWGSDADLETIICGLRGESLHVTRNCVSVLRRLRLEGEPRIVWIDAICIDQANIEERNAQVAIMGQIYETAYRVIADLGDTDEESDLALDAITRGATYAEWNPSASEIFHVSNAILRLWSRPWFSRVWVLQEVYRARDVQVLCGRRFTTWTFHLAFAIAIVANLYEWASHIQHQVPVILVWPVHEERQHTAKDCLLDILIQGRVCDATFRRDKVYGLLPMLQDASEAGLIADVAKSPVQVFTETATWLVKNVGLGVLYSAGQPSELDDLPSWVPDWSIKISASMGIGTSTDHDSKRGRAGGILKPIASVYHNHELIVRGVIFDKILQGTSTSLENRRGVAQLVANLRRRNMTEVSSMFSSLWPLSWSTVFGSRASDGNEIVALIARSPYHARYQLILTERGYLAIAVNQARIGDLVCCLMGVELPFILRETLGKSCEETQEHKHYTLIGDSYVYGIENGEAFADVDTSTVYEETALAPLVDFHIC